MEIESFKHFVDKINEDLGVFCQEFAQTRKELAQLGRSPKKDILFKYDSGDRDWAINEGGGTEIQYHIYLRDGVIGYGLGFNFQYVPFANEKSPVDWMKPYTEAFLELQRGKIDTKDFSWLIGNEDEIKNPQCGQYYLYGRTIEIKNDCIDDVDYQKMISDIKLTLFDIYKQVFNLKNENQKLINEKMEKNEIYKTLLLNNHNLILTGAPGTGKSYLAKQIAQQMILGEVKREMEPDEEKQFNEQCEFVQFHPSYDYTDFVEGLRPINDNGSVGFVLKDGVFKEFCAKALNNLINSKKSIETLSEEKSTIDYVNEFIDGSIENENVFDLANGNSFRIIENLEDKIYITASHIKNERLSVSKKNIFEIIKRNITLNDVKDVRLVHTAQTRQQQDSYVYSISKKIDRSKIALKEVSKVALENFVFIIDEINRGEISKIFGELFFSIDPSYRGKNGKVRTQYASMQKEPNAFDDVLNIKNSEECGHFFVPENVFIIGTMNDIDRSVESMDFAFRRRFAFKEIKATDSVNMLYDTEKGIGELADKANKRMINLNKAIETIEGLSSAYHIGPAYFLKLKNYNGDCFKHLWDNHIEGLLREYLRGMQRVSEKMKTLKNAYNDESDAPTNNG